MVGMDLHRARNGNQIRLEVVENFAEPRDEIVFAVFELAVGETEEFDGDARPLTRRFAPPSPRFAGRGYLRVPSPRLRGEGPRSGGEGRTGENPEPFARFLFAE